MQSSGRPVNNALQMSDMNIESTMSGLAGKPIGLHRIVAMPDREERLESCISRVWRIRRRNSDTSHNFVEIAFNFLADRKNGVIK